MTVRYYFTRIKTGVHSVRSTDRKPKTFTGTFIECQRAVRGWKEERIERAKNTTTVIP